MMCDNAEVSACDLSVSKGEYAGKLGCSPLKDGDLPLEKHKRDQTCVQPGADSMLQMEEDVSVVCNGLDHANSGAYNDEDDDGLLLKTVHGEPERSVHAASGGVELSVSELSAVKRCGSAPSEQTKRLTPLPHELLFDNRVLLSQTRDEQLYVADANMESRSAEESQLRIAKCFPSQSGTPDSHAAVSMGPLVGQAAKSPEPQRVSTDLETADVDLASPYAVVCAETIQSPRSVLDGLVHQRSCAPCPEVRFQQLQGEISELTCQPNSVSVSDTNQRRSTPSSEHVEQVDRFLDSNACKPQNGSDVHEEHEIEQSASHKENLEEQNKKSDSDEEDDWRATLSPIELSGALVNGRIMCSLDDVFSDVQQQSEAYYEQKLLQEQREEVNGDLSRLAAQIDAICNELAVSKQLFNIVELPELSEEEQMLVNSTFDFLLPRSEKQRTQTRLAAASARLARKAAKDGIHGNITLNDVFSAVTGTSDPPVRRRGRPRRNPPPTTNDVPQNLELCLSHNPSDGHQPQFDSDCKPQVPTASKRGRKRKSETARSEDSRNPWKQTDAAQELVRPSANILQMAMPSDIVLDERGEVSVTSHAQAIETAPKRLNDDSEPHFAAPFNSYSKQSRGPDYDYNVHVAQQTLADTQKHPVTQPVANGTSPPSMTSESSRRNAASPSTTCTSAQTRDIIDEYLEDLSLLQDKERMQTVQQFVSPPQDTNSVPSHALVNVGNSRPGGESAGSSQAVAVSNAAIPPQTVAAPQQPPGSSTMQLFTLWPGGTVIETHADSALAAIAAYNDFYAQQRPATSVTHSPRVMNMNQDGIAAQSGPNSDANTFQDPSSQPPVPVQLFHTSPCGPQQQSAAYYDPYAYTAANRFYTTAYGCDPALFAVATRFHPTAAYAYDAAYLMATLNAAGVTGANNQSAQNLQTPQESDQLCAHSALGNKYGPGTSPQNTVAVANAQQSLLPVAQSPQRPPDPTAADDSGRTTSEMYSQMSNPNAAYLYSTATRDPLAAAYAGLAGQRLAAAAAVLNAAGSSAAQQPMPPGTPQTSSTNGNASVNVNLNVNVNQTPCASGQPTLDSAARFVSPSDSSYLQAAPGAPPAGLANGVGQHQTAAYMQATAGQKYVQQSPMLGSPGTLVPSPQAPYVQPTTGMQQGAQEYFRAAAALYTPADAYQRFMMNRYY